MLNTIRINNMGHLPTAILNYSHSEPPRDLSFSSLSQQTLEAFPPANNLLTHNSTFDPNVQNENTVNYSTPGSSQVRFFVVDIFHVAMQF